MPVVVPGIGLMNGFGSTPLFAVCSFEMVMVVVMGMALVMAFMTVVVIVVTPSMMVVFMIMVVSIVGMGMGVRFAVGMTVVLPGRLHHNLKVDRRQPHPLDAFDVDPVALHSEQSQALLEQLPGNPQVDQRPQDHVSRHTVEWVKN